MQKISEFIINHQRFSKDQLRNLCKQKLISYPESWEKKLYSFISSWLDDKPHINVKTSGSTGKPKSIQLQKNRMVKSAEMTGKFLSLQKKQSTLLCLPANYIAGKMMIVRAFVLQLNLIFTKPSTQPLKQIKTPIDFTAMTPNQVYHSFNELKKVKTLIIGGTHIPNNLQTQLSKLNNNIYHTYGMTETITHVALKKIGGKKLQKYFYALPNINFSIDKRNCLIIKAPHLIEQSITTNDVVKLNGSKQFEWLGRHDLIINSGGIKIIPEEIEQIIKPFLKNNFFLSSKKDPILGQKLILLIEGKQIPTAPLKKMIENTLSYYYVPKEIIFIPKFVYTENGKINRKKTLSQSAK